MKVVAILQARMSSSRLPGKVLKPILGEPMLAHQLKRIARSSKIDTIVVATSTENEDEPIASLCQQLDIACFRGSLDNVLDRFYCAATEYQADIVVRLTGDCPLADADIIDQVISMHLSQGNEYTSNVEPPTFPDGFDVEVLNMTQLRLAWQRASLPSDLEHVTPYIRNTLAVKKGNFESPTDYSHYRLTVDEPNDFELVKIIYQELGENGQYFSSEQIYKLLSQQPKLLTLNQNITRNEGYIASLNQDKHDKKACRVDVD
ncbi:cytidylyltransferase domain-containing protein [Thalassotalea euphylliae]|uniref:Spore coat protein n=1 Tax=Thalassotalea euphylliae TaxID=1655234 RepID=A0A3E0U003_9GAMM|nr:glycosyltransferase family protein [Thalassotalea euphylliae]REL30271.1 spore coat protein [Thalassotalea euphylliae]